MATYPERGFSLNFAVKPFSDRRANWLILIVAVLIVLLLLADFWEYTQDDVFITYAYSRNLALGNGFVFNPGEHVQGTTTPLYTLLMAVVYRLTPDLLHAGNALSALCLLIGCGFAARVPRPTPTRIGQVALVLAVLTAPLIYVSFGMETLFYFAVLMASFWLWSQQRRALAMLGAAALTWTRADGLVLGAALCLAAFWEAQGDRPWWRSIPWRLGLLYCVAILPWFLFAWAYFGTPLPNTFSAKEELLHGVKFWTDGLNWWKSFYGNDPLSLLAIPLIGVGWWQALHRPNLRPLAVWPILYLIGYTALNVTAFWYYTAVAGEMILLAVIGGEYLAQRLTTTPYPIKAATVRIIGVGAILLTTGLSLIRDWDFHAPPERVATYRLLGEWLAHNTPPQSTVVVADLGIVGYYAERRMIDSFGLIVPSLTATHDPVSAVQKFRPDYVVATQYFFFQQFVHSAWFSADYVPLVQFSTLHDSFSPMTVYRRRTPPPAGASPVKSLVNEVLPAQPLTADWLADHQIFVHLNDSTLPDGDQTWSGGTLTVQLNWQVIAVPADDYSLFVHLQDASGKLVAQADGAPNGQSVTGWQKSAQIADLRQIALPPTLPTGDYVLTIGWYNWRTGQRLLLQSRSADAADNLRLPYIIHNQWPGGSGLP